MLAMADLVAELARAIKRDDAKAVVTAASKVLHHDKADKDALEAKAVALIFENKYEEVIALAGDHKELAFHKAYAHYKCDRIAEALTVASAVSDPSEGVQHLTGQLLYRLGRYAEAAAVYEKLLKLLVEDGADDADIDDVRLNFAAAAVAAGQSAAVIAHPEFAKIMEAIAKGKASQVGFVFELLYNAACALIEAGNPSLAMKALQAAYVTGEKFLLEDGVEISKIADDLAIIRAQAAYLLQQGHYDEAATALYSNILTSHPSDPAVAVGIATNLAQLKTTGHSLVESYKRLKSLAGSTTLARMPKKQVATLHFNRAVSSFLLKRFDDCKSALADARAAINSSSNSKSTGMLTLLDEIAVLESVAAVSQTASSDLSTGLADVLIKVMEEQADHAKAVFGMTPSTTIRAHLLASDGKYNEAADFLCNAVKRAGGNYHPAVAAAVAQLRLLGGTSSDAISFLSQLIAEAGKSSAGDGVTLAISLLHQRAAFHVLAHNVDEAAKDYDTIAKMPGVPNELKGAALSCLAMVRTQQAAALGTGSTRDSALSEADMTLREATALAVGVGGRKPSFADISKFTEQATNAIEWPAEGSARKTAASSTAVKESAGPLTTSVGGALPTAAAPTAEELAATARAAAKLARKRRKALIRRAKRRETYLAKLRARGDYDVAGIPNAKPDPERWLAKSKRTYGSKTRRRNINKSVNVSSGAAQGNAGSESVTRDLDAKARSDAKKTTAAAPAATPAPAPAVVKRKMGKGGRR